MGLSIFFTLTLLEVCAGNPRQILPGNDPGSGAADVTKDVFSNILTSNQASDEKYIIQAAMDELMVLTCIQFVVRTTESNYLRIHPNDGCWSYIGRVGAAQDVSLMKARCLHRGIIQHELMHSLGFQHEQCRSDRDKYIRINWGNISQDKERNFYKLSTPNLGTPYDYQSVLHYGKYAFANDVFKPTLEPTVNPDATIGQRIGLSSLDVVKINKLYKCS
ncbi:astacin-like metalloendopeptidase [Pelobates cultripes]|uniref:Metalloendopeptidase n=1 Tax=Pelobates cultripes TaxID=61616 RepID=A0AAD1TJ50_PELCU|nr:astacin-like metalloendopeptidase [Pelobates cultripes]